MTRWDALFAGLAGGLIVSVQAEAGSPLDDPQIIAALAREVAVPGCVALRINSPAHIRAVREAVALPIIGIDKRYTADRRVWITPTFEAARKCALAGATIVAIDATGGPRAFGEEVPELIGRIHGELGLPVMADVACLEEGVAAARAGADLVASTLSGYVPVRRASPYDPPDLQLVADLARAVGVPVIAEGRYNTPALAGQALRAGALAVVVGSAITRPGLIAASFARELAAARPAAS